MHNHCGNCHRCEQACPTAALSNGCCDANKCLSFWTIEAQSPTPEHISQTAPERIYGCDICQEACPWNRPRPNQSPHIDPHLLMPDSLSSIPPTELSEMSEEEFLQFFTGSPIRRIGHHHLQNNLRHLHD